MLRAKPWGRSMVSRAMRSAEESDERETVAIDNGSSRTALNSRGYFLEETLNEENAQITVSINGEKIRPTAVGTAVFKIFNEKTRQYIIVCMKGANLHEEYPESVLGQVQLNRSENLYELISVIRVRITSCRC